MRPSTLKLELHGKVSLDAFAEAIGHFKRYVDALTRETAAGAEVRWVVDELHAGSAEAIVKAEGDLEAAASVGVAYIEVGRAVENGNGGLSDYPRAVRDEILALVRMVGPEFEYVRFETADADATVTTVREQVASLEPGPMLTKAYGGIQGRVQTLTNRGELRFTLFDSLYDRAVSCYLTEGQEDLMRDAWGRLAVVEGIVTRDPINGRPLNVRSVNRVTLVHEAPPDGYMKARGALHPTQDALSPEDSIRRIRDAA